GSKWVFKNKMDERGIVIRNKARLVAQGHTQEEEEEVYVCQPPGFEDLDFPDNVEKALYGLHQAPRACDYAGASLDIKSITGGCKFLGCRLILWQCKKQTVVANFTTKAEYVTASSCCGQIKTINDDVQLQALIDGKKIVINEASIRHDLKLNDAEESRNRVFWCSHILFGTMMVQALEEVHDLPTDVQDTPIPDAPSSSQLQRKYKLKRKETDVSPTKIHTKDHVPTTSNNPLPSGEDRMQLKELMDLSINLSNKVLDLENEVIEMKSSHKAKIAELESRVEKLEEKNKSLTKDLKSFNNRVESLAIKETVVDEEESSNQGRKITDIDSHVQVNLENMHILNMAHEETDLKMVNIMEITKIIVDEVSTVVGELNAANEGPVSAAPTNITTAQPIAQARKNMMIYLKNMVGFKMEFFKGMSYEEIIPLFEEEYKTVQTLFKEGPEMDAERIKNSRKRTRKEKVEKDQPTKKQKRDKLEQDNVEKQKLEEQPKAKELKKNLEIVLDDEDDVFVNVTTLSAKPPTIMDYKIYKEGKKEHFQIIRVNGSRTESGFKHAFATLSGQDIETFTGTMFLNVEQLEKQHDKEDFQEIGSMAAFSSIDERVQLKREYDSLVNEKQMRTIEEKVDTSKALDASSVDTESTNMGLWYPKGSSFDLTGFLDVDHAGCIDSRKITSGGIQFLGDKLVSWMSKKQNCTAMSSAEAEYVALSASFSHSNLIQPRTALPYQAHPYYVSLHKGTGSKWYKTKYQLADMFTKALPEERFKYLARRIGMRCLTPAELEVLVKESA
nr:hypothetical protein [Tanacetum cinerariifolium]